MSWLRQLLSGEGAAARRKKQVENDGLFYCRGCATKGVERPSDDATGVCSKACLERFNAASLCQAMSGGVVVMLDSGLEGHAALNRLRSRKWKTYCAWCGAAITDLHADTCPKCHGNPSGSQEFPSSPPEKTCPMCGARLRSFQVEHMGEPGYTPWFREGYCSLACFQKKEAQQQIASDGRTDAAPQGDGDSGGNRYYNKQWNFSIVYPSDWELLWENRPQGSWVMAVAVAGNAGDRVRPGLIVNARRGEVLEGSSNVTVVYIGGDAAPTQAPKTPKEYIERQKADLKEAFSGLRFISAEETRLSNKPATRLVYSYATGGGRIQEMCATILGVGVTFQITCEVAPDEFDKFKPTFDAVINSFNIGSEPASTDEAKPTAQPAKAGTPIQLYNQGVKLYQKGQFKRAMEVFSQVFNSGQLKMQSAYIRALCQKELGLAVEIPPQLGDKAEDAGTIYVASNLACHIIAQGQKAALTKQGSTSEVTALIDGSLYVISISSLFGRFNNWAWRKEGEESISVPDPDVNPNPTKTDKLVISLAEKAGVMPPEPMPEGGVPTTWE